MTFDRLTAMVVRQHELQEMLKELPAPGSNKERLEYLRTSVLACIAELMEALNETGWKPWASSDHIYDDRAFGELRDAWQFLTNAMFAVCPHWTPEELAQNLYAAHANKVRVNIERAQQGYDGVSNKCHVCQRALDDAGVTCTPGHCTEGFVA